MGRGTSNGVKNLNGWEIEIQNEDREGLRKCKVIENVFTWY